MRPQPQRLPPRYARSMQSLLFERLEPLLVPGVRVLDVGSGRHPFIAPADRPPGCRYVGTDISDSELVAAPIGSYDHVFVADVTQGLSESEQFDIVVSWQVLEHVSDMEAALASLRGAIVPGGFMFAQLSGGRAVFAVLARVLPHRARTAIMKRLLGAKEEEKFPTTYDSCTASALRRLGSRGWSEFTVDSYYRAATYFAFSRLASDLYLRVEDLLERRRAEDFATHYLIVARR